MTSSSGETAKGAPSSSSSSSFPRPDAAAATNTNNGLQAAHRFQGGSSDQNHHSAALDPLSSWMRERQQAFRDLERSFHDQQPPPRAAADPLLGLGFDSGHFPGIPAHPVHHHPAVSLFETPKPTAATMLSTRDHANQELSPKAKVSYDDKKFEVEFDVREFRPEELSIKTDGDVLVVLAKHETKTEGGGSFVSKQFEQRFTLPSGVRPDSITSSLAKDGTLTVSAPREVPKADLAGFRRRGSGNDVVAGSGRDGNVYAHDGGDEKGLPHPKVKYDEDKFQITLDCQHYRPEELDVKVEGSTIIIAAKQEIKEPGGTRTKLFEQKFTLPAGVKAEKVTSNYGKDGTLSITAPRGNASAPITHLEQRMDRVMAPSAWKEQG